MYTTVYLIRNAETAWNDERRLAGKRELGLSARGHESAARLATCFAGIELDELLVSPLPRTVETAQALASARGLEVARDPRLSDWQPGEWEGRTYSEIVTDPRYLAMVGQPTSSIVLPGGERFADILARMLGSITQALEDNQLGASIAVVSHAGPLRILLSHYLSIPAWDHERLGLAPASVTALRFSSLSAPPELVGLNLTGPLLDTVSASR